MPIHQHRQLVMSDGTAYTVDLYIDLDQIFATLGTKALRNKTGRSFEMGGLVTARIAGNHARLRDHERTLRKRAPQTP